MKTSPILEQINAIRCTLQTPDTGDTVLQFLSTLWKLLRSLVLLFFLFGLLAIAAAVWLWGSAFQKGREYREWLNQDPVPENEAFFAKLGQDLQAFFSGLSTFSGTLALSLLGVQETEPVKAGSQPTLQPGSTTTVAAPSATKQPK